MPSALLGEFDSADACATAIVKLRERGHPPVDAYMPYAAKNVEEALELPPSPLPGVVLCFGTLGACVAYLILWWTQSVNYPLNVGSHPTHSVPAFVGITFETMVLFASFAAFFGMLHFCRLPRLWHKAFEVPGLERASVDRFFVVLPAERGKGRELYDLLEDVGALRIVPVTFDEEGT
ncbi:MAG TPA: DUF3341 domain-containing protein [Polyangiaceae bacterium]|nr:DUF3341 domain-containing protein [Polyangiaceae bacterium]